MNDNLLTSIQGLIRQGDELHAQHVEESERSVAASNGRIAAWVADAQ
jgi:hypothetical protein